MKVRYLGSQSGACDIYRGSLPFKYVESDTEFIKAGVSLMMDRVSGDIVGTNIEADVVIVPRPSSEAHYNVARGAKMDGIAVVVEIDDELDAVHPKNHAYEYANAGVDWLYKTLELADLITVSSHRLAQKYHPEKAVVIPNYVHDALFDFELNTEKHGIGWTGSVGVHPNDLQQVGDSIRRIVSETDWDFRHIGGGDIRGIIKCNYIAYGNLEYSQYLLGIDSFAVGIVPLEASDFNNSKSWLKGVEYASLGVPFVASPTDEYKRLRKEFGVGMIARNPHEWYTKLKKLVSDDKGRQELAEEYRQIAYDNFRMSTNAYKWDEAWAEAVERSRYAV